jgi:hypothetical protein
MVYLLQFNAEILKMVRKGTAVANSIMAEAEALLPDEETRYEGG